MYVCVYIERQRNVCVCVCVCSYASSENQEHCFVCFSFVFTEKLRQVNNIYIRLPRSPTNVE